MANLAQNWKYEDWENEPLSKAEAKEFRGLVARLDFLSADCPEL